MNPNASGNADRRLNTVGEFSSRWTLAPCFVLWMRNRIRNPR
jgi:hypothetical protein